MINFWKKESDQKENSSYATNINSENKGSKIASTVQIHPTAEIINNTSDKNKIVEIGENSNIGAYATIINNSGSIKIGKNFRAGRGAQIASWGGIICISDDVAINDYSVIYGHGGLSIGRGTQIATHCVIIPANHNFYSLDKEIRDQGVLLKGIAIGKDVWIGANVVILDGVTIGEGSVIGAGSVVTKSMPPLSIVAGNPARVIKKRDSIDVLRMENINLNAIDRISQNEIEIKRKETDFVMQYNSQITNVLAKEERAFPGNKEFLESGHYKNMLKRYLFAGKCFCEEKKVLDTCSGLGWGTYLAAQYANKMTAFDLDKDAVDFCRKTWPTKNVEWKMGDALNMSFLGASKFDVVLGMETIEHFSKENGEAYVAECQKKLNEGGYFIGTSGFPETRKEADEICATNPYHLYIFTNSEMENLLKKYFSKHRVISNWMFVAKK